MDKIDYILALEKLNFEYLKKHGMHARLSDIEIAGLRFYNLKKHFPMHMFSFVKKHLRRKRKEKINSQISKFVPDNEVWYATGTPNDTAKGVVYTCITNGYDVPYEPLFCDTKLKYILFSDKEKADKSRWEYSKIDGALDSKTNYANRYYKFHPFELFYGHYDYSIYIDGNVQIISDITYLYNVAKNSKIGIAMHSHASRTCAYLDAKWCAVNNRGNVEYLEKQMQKYKKEGFPKNFGLCEATIIVVDLHNNNARLILNEWWNEFCKSKSERDQPSLPYILWKMGLTMDDIGCLGNNEYRNPKFIISSHG